MLFSRDDLLQTLNGFNPWWSRRSVTVPSFRRAFYGACRRHLESRSHQFALLLSGLRGTGKTTALLQLATDLVESGADPRSVLYLGVGHPVFTRVPLSEILQLYRDIIHAKDRPAVLLLDEAHYARDWDFHVKRLLSDESGYRIIATESVQMIERALVTETQLGRWSSMSAPSLSFYEYLQMRGLDPGNVPACYLARRDPMRTEVLEEVARALAPVQSHFLPYLVSGGLPWLAAAGEWRPGSRSLMYEDAAENILRRDIALHFGARNVEDLKRLFVYLCMHSGDIFPVQRYAHALGVSASTVANHVELLERCFLVKRLAPVGVGGVAVQKVRHRIFVTDTTLRNVQLLRDVEHLTDPDDLRRVVATSMARHVAARWAMSLANIGYWRDVKTRSLVDIVVKDQGSTLVFQEMYDTPTTLQEKHPLLVYCRKENVARAILVTRDGNDLTVFRVPGVDTEFVKVPAHVAMYLLGRSECEAAASA